MKTAIRACSPGSGTRIALLAALLPSLAGCTSEPPVLTHECTSCRVVVTRVAALGDIDGDAILGDRSVVARLHDGRIAVATHPNWDQLFIFDETGTFIRTVGRNGAGPGEYRRIDALATVPSGLAVFDARNRRISILDAAFDLSAEYPLEGMLLNVAAIDDSTFVVNMDRPPVGDTSIPLSLHRGAMGSVARFGDPGYDWPDLRRALAVNGDGTIWGVVAASYRIEQYTQTGELLGSVRREPTWFRPLPVAATSAEPPPPVTWTWAAQIDASGRLWVATMLPDPQWQQGLGRDERGNWYFRDFDKYYDTMIEVIDLGTLELVADVRLDPYLSGFAGDGYAYSYRGPDDTPGVVLWRLELDQE